MKKLASALVTPQERNIVDVLDYSLHQQNYMLLQNSGKEKKKENHSTILNFSLSSLRALNRVCFLTKVKVDL